MFQSTAAPDGKPVRRTFVIASLPSVSFSEKLMPGPKTTRVSSGVVWLVPARFGTSATAVTVTGTVRTVVRSATAMSPASLGAVSRVSVVTVRLKSASLLAAA